MIKRMAFGALMCALLGSAALAQSTPAPTDSTTSGPATTAAPAAPETTPPAATPAPASGQQAALETPEDCMKLATDLAQSAEEKDLSADKLDKIDDLLIKMETHCDAKQFSDAMTVATAIKAMMDTQ